MAKVKKDDLKFDSEYRVIKFIERKIKFDTIYGYKPIMYINVYRKNNKLDFPMCQLNKFRYDNGIENDGFWFQYQKHVHKNFIIICDVYLEDGKVEKNIINLDTCRLEKHICNFEETVMVGLFDEKKNKMEDGYIAYKCLVCGAEKVDFYKNYKKVENHD
jgi:hypothetical protein